MSEAGFHPSHAGEFMARDGPARKAGASYCNKKICLAATDLDFLIALLQDLSERDDCYFVKYSVTPRDGMYLGRCFLTSEQAAGALWKKLKPHPKLLCSIQDDFTESFRHLD